MYLKRVESTGFKSFAERIEVEFVPGVNAVVGPNGSGKSNMIDAVRWVLGEQSARSLRGSKMEDIIFQGSDTRRPLNMAEVTLVLDNAERTLPLDFAEVSITRRVYRSGESEFYVNKQACRLKDIIELLLDSGLGREAFSIISQGRVEEILSSKAEERRSIFEEAAGVLKYKQRKQKAEFKLAETGDNLERVQDIIHELETQIEPLHKQAEAARKYNELKNELKEQEISLLLAEIDQLHAQWKNVLLEIEQAETEEIQRKTAVQKREIQLEAAQQETAKIDKAVEQHQAELLAMTEAIEQAEGKKQVLAERTKHAAASKEKLADDVQQLQKRLENAETKLNEAQLEVRAIQAKKQETEGSISRLEDVLHAEEPITAEHIENLKADYIELLNEQAAFRNEKQSIEQQEKQLLARRQFQQKKKQQVMDTRNRLASEKSRSDETLKTATAAFQAAETDAARLKKELGQNRLALTDAQKRQQFLLQQLAKLRSKKELLADMKAGLQGFYSGTKAVLQAAQAQTLSGVEGAVIQLIKVPKNLLTAIETVLGAAAQHVIVKDEKRAREAIAYLKKTGQGRATFLPLATIQPRFISADARNMLKQHPGFLGIAAETIEYAGHLKPAIEHLMGHVILARSLEDANAIASLVNRRFRIVTLDGDVVNPGGSMSGGAQKKNGPSLFSRERDLLETVASLESTEREAGKAEKAVHALETAAADLEGQSLLAEQKIAELREQWQAARHAAKESELKLEAATNALQVQQFDEAHEHTELTSLADRSGQIRNKLEQAGAQTIQIQKEIERLTLLQENAKRNKEETRSDIHRNQLLLAQLNERLQAAAEKMKNNGEVQQQLSEQLAVAKADLASLQSAEEAEKQKEQLSLALEESQRSKSALLETIQVKRELRLKLTKQIQHDELELKAEGRILQKLSRERQEKEIRANRLDVSLENKLGHLQEEYMITHQKAAEQYEKCAHIEAAVVQVEKLKTAIERLGTVNLGAIEEYERIVDRFTFLKEQQADLLEARNTLKQAITELDEEMAKLFGETFTSIQAHFSQVFKELFGGGHAELQLTDPENLLETGVEIIAEPPGKKMKNLSLLSGGERALTAIALLFSILRVRPVPFCILDEVEAALDEANVMRFAKYLHMYSMGTQFIVITHRKGTMEEADVLYGVTMEESGVSRLVSVRLNDAKELVNS